MDKPMRASEAATDPAAILRERLIEMQHDLVVAMLRGGFSSGVGRLLGEIAAAEAALDSTPQNAAESGGAAGLPGRRVPGQALPPIASHRHWPLLAPRAPWLLTTI